MNPTEKSNSLNQSKEEENYFQLFNFLKFKKILFPLLIVAFLLIIKQFITNNFQILKHTDPGLLNLLSYSRSQHDFPVWVNIFNTFIEILIIIVLLCWEAVYEKKYDKIKFILLLCLPSIAINFITTYSDLYESGDKSPYYIIYSILSYFSYYSLYGLFRGKILYGKKLSFMGYLIGMIALISLATLYQKIASVLLMSDFLTPLYSYGLVLTSLFFPLSVFYFFFLSDAGFSFKNLVKIPTIALVEKEKFIVHFSFLFTALLAFHLFFTENFSSSWFDYESSDYWGFVSNLYIIGKLIFKVAFVYLIFSQLLLVQLGALKRRPLWIYLLSFVPVVNLIPLFLFYRKSAPVTNEEYYTIADKDERNRSSLQLFILFSIMVYSIYKYGGLVGSQESFLIIAAITVFYSLVLFLRIGVWITIGILGIVVVLLLFQDIPTGLYYLGFASYCAIGLYNLHVALFWETEEWIDIDENTELSSN